MVRSFHWFGLSTARYGYGLMISFEPFPVFISKVKDSQGECAPVKIWKSLSERFATGFFKKVKRIKIFGIEFKVRVGEEFHGLIASNGKVLSCYGLNGSRVMPGYENDPEVQDPWKEDR